MGIYSAKSSDTDEPYSRLWSGLRLLVSVGVLPPLSLRS